ncbi:MAG: endonuclease [Paenibacillaceae bacterium]|jgi:sugar phosphate isomerase/epimerase|nr:endonuclease [Paenibacillaceae bacterium]
MKLGMPTLVEFAGLEDNLELCRRLDLDFVEVNMNLPVCNPEATGHGELLRLKRQYGVDLTVHLPEELDLGSIHGSIRQGHVQRCREAIDWASRAEIGLLNLHLNPGIYFTLPDRKVWIYEAHQETFLANLAASYSELYSYAKEKSVLLCIENACNFHLPFIRNALDRLAAFEEFTLTWDVGHDAKTGFAEGPVFAAYPERLKHMHLHDFDGKQDHARLYTGLVPVNDRLALAESKGIRVVVEVKTSQALEASIHSIRMNFPLKE